MIALRRIWNSKPVVAVRSFFTPHVWIGVGFLYGCAITNIVWIGVTR